jgi:carbamoyl-phosphate synthase small subunit
VTKKFSSGFSRTSASGSLQDFMEQNDTVGISDIDTRALVRHIRNKGAMNAIISSEILDVSILKEKLAAVPSMEGLELSSRVSTSTAYEVKPESAKYKVALVGLSKNERIRLKSFLLFLISFSSSYSNRFFIFFS